MLDFLGVDTLQEWSLATEDHPLKGPAREPNPTGSMLELQAEGYLGMGAQHIRYVEAPPSLSYRMICCLLLIGQAGQPLK